MEGALTVTAAPEARFDVAPIRAFAQTQGAATPPLSPFERAKLDDLADDLAWIDAHPDARSWLGGVYARFERFWGRPGAARFGLAGGSAAQPTPPVLPVHVDEQRLLDRLSLWYGGQYRGAIVLNYGLALVGGVAVVIGHALGHLAEIAFGAVEIACILAIMLFYFIGRTPLPAFNDAAASRPLIARRWHQRWLEYRVLAERFRYAALLQPFDERPRDAWARLVEDESESPGWVDRYFLWRLGDAPATRLSDDAWYAMLIATMDHQAWYHAQAGARRHNVVHRLHVFAVAAFVTAFVAIAARVVFTAVELKYFDGHNPFGLVLLDPVVVLAMLAGLGTLLAASVHGVLGTTELGRVAETSVAAAQRIDALRRLVEEKHARGMPPAEMRVEVEQFCRLVTQEGRHWHGILRDKDVPLVH